jgi:hypothetical protein
MSIVEATHSHYFLKDVSSFHRISGFDDFTKSHQIDGTIKSLPTQWAERLY